MRKNVTISLPPALADEIDRRAGNRSRFIVEAVEARLEALRRDELARSLDAPHAASADGDDDLGEWVAAGAGDDDLLDPRDGRRVSWRPGRGWAERR